MSNLSNQNLPAAAAAGLFGAQEDDAATREVDDHEVLDPDADDELIDSADADRIAADPDAADDEALGRG